MAKLAKFAKLDWHFNIFLSTSSSVTTNRIYRESYRVKVLNNWEIILVSLYFEIYSRIATATPATTRTVVANGGHYLQFRSVGTYRDDTTIYDEETRRTLPVVPDGVERFVSNRGNYLETDTVVNVNLKTTIGNKPRNH